jgi:hypothetical protein
MRATLWALSATAFVAAATLPVAQAATCADQPVSARGEASTLEVLAKAKARGNWRAKVRVLPGLGAAYADWYKATGADYRCADEKGGTVCVAVALPCRD